MIDRIQPKNITSIGEKFPDSGNYSEYIIRSASLNSDPVGAKILRFPDNRVAKLRRLVRAVKDSFTSGDGARLCGLDLFSFSMGPGGYDLRVDDYACIDLFPGSPDYRFTISMRDGTRTLLVTADPIMMADFLRQYILARIECHLELQEHP